MKDYDKALADVNEALRLDPKLLRGHRLVRGHIYNGSEAIRQSHRGIRRGLRHRSCWFLDALYHRANTRFRPCHSGAAIKDYEDLLQAQPKHADGLNELAWILATCPEDKFRDGKKALDLAKTLNVLTMEKNPSPFRHAGGGLREVGPVPGSVHCMKLGISQA